MTTITIPRALLEQALEALEACYSPEYYGAKIYAAKLALRAALAAPDDVAEEMSAVADQYAHKLALDLECVLADYSGTWYDTAICTLGAYRGAMNAIHERESPTFMGEPAIRPTQAAPAPDDRHAQELLAMEITLQNMEARHAEELAAYELTVANLRAELAKPVEQAEQSWNRSIRDSVDVLLAEAGYQPDSSARHQLSMMNFDQKAQATPAWHDAPTCAGLWVCNEGKDNPYRWTTHPVSFPHSPLLIGKNERWYGPIPQDGEKS